MRHYSTFEPNLARMIDVAGIAYVASNWHFVIFAFQNVRA